MVNNKDLALYCVAFLSLVVIFWWSSANVSLTQSKIPHRAEHFRSQRHLFGRRTLAKNLKLLCMVLTTAQGSHLTKTLAIEKTWGSRCDRLIFLIKGDKTQEIKVSETESILEIQLPEESRSQLWVKIRAAMEFIYNRYLDKYDWFYKADDDTYLLVDRLKKFLATESDSSEAIYFGFRFKTYVKQGYMSGGSGYALSRQSLKLLVEDGIQKNLSACSLEQDEVEDLNIGSCLEKVKVQAGDTRDSKGRPRFIVYPPDHFLQGNEVGWLENYTYYNVKWSGKDCCSDDPIAFHYIKPKRMYLIDWLLYDVKRSGLE